MDELITQGRESLDVKSRRTYEARDRRERPARRERTLTVPTAAWAQNRHCGLARGFTRADIAAHLDLSENVARYALQFVDDQLIAQGTYGNLPFETLDTGTFIIRGNGFQIVVDGVQGAASRSPRPSSKARG